MMGYSFDGTCLSHRGSQLDGCLVLRHERHWSKREGREHVPPSGLHVTVTDNL